MKLELKIREASSKKRGVFQMLLGFMKEKLLDSRILVKLKCIALKLCRSE